MGELQGVSPEQQQFRIKLKADYFCILGCIVVVIFSDPMVDVLAEVARRIGVSPFFVSFIFSPLVSNASELIAAYNYAAKKTVKSATISLATLEGAACMNNTFCLAIFLFVIWITGLEWNFTVETLNVVIMECVIIGFAWNKTVHTMREACFIFSMYGYLMLQTWFLQNVLGLS